MKIKSFNEFINESFKGFFKNVNLDLSIEMEQWCKEMGIENYEIVDEGDRYIINVNGDVNIKKRNLNKFPYKFGIITGNFDCSYNNLESLENSPDIVKGIFDCSYNRNLKSLEGGPKKAKIYYCIDCNLESLEGSPEECEIFNCDRNNNLKNLIGATQNVKKFSVNFCNNLESLEGAPEEVETFECFYCENLKNLIGGPRIVTKKFDCRSSGLITLEGAPEKCSKFICGRNPGDFTEEDVRKYIKEVNTIVIH